MEDVDRLGFIKQVVEKETYGDNSLLYALVRCLSINEIIQLLIESMFGNLRIRNAALKVFLEIGSESWDTSFEHVVDKLIDQFEDLPSNRKSSHYYCLGEINHIAPKYIRDKIVSHMLKSRYASGRRRALRLLEPGHIEQYKSIIERYAFEKHELSAIKIIVSDFSIEYLYQNRTKLVRLFEEKWLLGRFFLRIAPKYPDTLQELRELDLISYAYVMAKLRFDLPNEDVNLLIENYHSDDRFGLVIWAFGKLNYWDHLINISLQQEEWEREKYLSWES